MESQTKNNLTITGVTEALGGTYDSVKILGEAKFSAEMNCRSLYCYGKAEMTGYTHAKVTKIFGTAFFSSHFETDQTSIFGEAEIDGDLSFKVVKCFGSVAIRGHMSGDTVKLKGELKASNNVEAENFLGSGGFTVGGLLNADCVDIRLYGPCTAKEIGGEKIKIRTGGPLNYLSRLFGSFHHGNLTTDIIEGDEIYLENTRAKIVRGNHITIGSGCVIDLVEYKDHFSQSKDAKVNQQNQI